jgi:orotate phosphoribosyltransferase
MGLSGGVEIRMSIYSRGLAIRFADFGPAGLAAGKEASFVTQVNRSTEQDVALKAELVEAFLETESFRYDPDKGFKLASGQISPFYVDCRMLMAHPGPRRLVAQVAWERLRGVDFDCLGGLEIGAISIATTISDYAFAATPRRSWRTFVVRKQAKDHGLGKLIEGGVRPGDRTVIVDDVLTSGGSLLKAVAAARDVGLNVEHALVIVDRKEQDGRARVEAQGLRLLSLLTIDDFQARPGPDSAR